MTSHRRTAAPRHNERHAWWVCSVILAGCHLAHERPHAAPDASLQPADAGAIVRDDATVPELPPPCSPWLLGVERLAPGDPRGDDVTASPIALRMGSDPVLAVVTHEALANAGEGDLAIDPSRCTTVDGATTCVPDVPSSWDGPGRVWLWMRGEGHELPLPEGAVAATSTLASADLDANGKPEIVAFSPRGGAIAFDHEGAVRWRADVPSLDELRVDDPALPGGRPRSLSGTPLIVDLEGDGELEIALGYGLVEGRTGAVRWRASGHRGINGVYGPVTCADDLDGDGALEIVAGGTAYRADGSVLWQAPVSDGFCAIGEREIALVSEGTLTLLGRDDGEVRWSTQLAGTMRTGATGPAGGPPTIVDVDGDGDEEILVASESRLLLYDRDCNTPGCAIDGWSIAIEDPLSGVTGVTVVDVDSDGVLEVLHADQATLRVLDARTGALRAAVPRLSRTRTERPLFGDFDGDGASEIMIGVSSEWDGNHTRRGGTRSAGLAMIAPVCAHWSSPVELGFETDLW